VKGLNDEDKCPRVRNLLREWKVDIVCFQETKLEVMSCSVVRSLWGCHYVDWCCLDSRGAFGGILIMWDRRVVEKIDECVGEFTLAILFRNVEDYFSWAFAGIYGPNSDGDGRFLWDELAGLLSWWNFPWCIGRAFNITRFPSERLGADFIFYHGLMDLPLVGGKFTWSNNWDSPSLVQD